MRRILLFSGVILLCLAGCSTAPDRDPVLGEAYIGPSSLQIREDLTARAGLIATLKHGDKVDLIGQRRRFYKVRIASGREGWVDGRQLLATGDMDYLKRLAQRAGQAPAQGKASVYEALNVHTAPNRQAPSFFQITHDGKVDVIAYELAPRVAFEPPEFIRASPVAQVIRKARSKPKAAPKVPPPPPPKAPGLPPNWLELSRNPEGLIRPKPKPPETAPPNEPAPLDSWTLVRSADGRAGWVLARMLLMSIPDEVAQHAERARIAAYFVLGQTLDRGVSKPVWLWATLARTGVSYEFDSMRIFVWNNRRRRYETSYVERNLKGWLPIQVSPMAGFSAVVEEKDGRLMERTYELNNFRARIASRRPARLPAPWAPAAAKAPANPDGSRAADPRWQDKAKGFVEELKGKLTR